MKVNNFKDLQNIKTLEDMIRFTGLDMNAMISVINGGIDLVDNCNTVLVSFSIPKANITYGFTHNLGRVPQGYLLAGLGSNAVIFNGNTPNNTTQIFIQANAVVSGKMLVF